MHVRAGRRRQSRLGLTRDSSSRKCCRPSSSPPAPPGCCLDPGLVSLKIFSLPEEVGGRGRLDFRQQSPSHRYLGRLRTLFTSTARPLPRSEAEGGLSRSASQAISSPHGGPSSGGVLRQGWAPVAPSAKPPPRHSSQVWRSRNILKLRPLPVSSC
ncbi:uncharacterized protein LOC127750965 [Frankliniella occidentalis]|uniref:Uncharacterized protein LOC127750965 n=1 Tax=Frankliniella occidentalis TaxID=133901 RepID=A0A9C6XSU2_FRAOC|nr:uncharacterized protein LOC127750965 [Frankliniella occidentalis]